MAENADRGTSGKWTRPDPHSPPIVPGTMVMTIAVPVYVSDAPTLNVSAGTDPNTGAPTLTATWSAPAQNAASIVSYRFPCLSEVDQPFWIDLSGDASPNVLPSVIDREETKGSGVLSTAPAPLFFIGRTLDYAARFSSL